MLIRQCNTSSHGEIFNEKNSKVLKQRADTRKSLHEYNKDVNRLRQLSLGIRVKNKVHELQQSDMLTYSSLNNYLQGKINQRRKNQEL